MNQEQKPLAVISGGNGYLGKSLTSVLTQAGWMVVLLGRTKSDDSEFSYVCDVANEEDVAKNIAAIVEKYGKVSACIHAASSSVDGKLPLLSLTASEFDTPIQVAVRGGFILAKYVAPHMEKDAAFIGITTALIEPEISLQPMGPYIAAKYALRGLLRSLALELKQQSIRVYAVAPGYLPGGLNSGIPEAVIKFLGKKSGTGDTTPEAVAEVVLKLCTESNAYPSGVSITIPGEVHQL